MIENKRSFAKTYFYIFLFNESKEAMLRPYSDDLRLRMILHRCGEEQFVQEIAQNLNVSQRKDVRICQLFRQHGTIQHPRIGREVVRHKS